MKCFVTGLTGFVGSHLASHLASLGAEVFGIGLDRQPDAPFTAVECDILDFDKLARLITDFEPDFVYHLAALPNPSESLKRPREYYRVNEKPENQGSSQSTQHTAALPVKSHQFPPP